MGFFSRRRPDLPPRSSRLRLMFVVLLFYGCIRVFGPQLQLPRRNAAPPPPPPIIAAVADAEPTGQPILRIGGRRVWGDGAYIDLGDRRTHLPGSLFSRFFPDPLVLPSCLTEAAPALGPASRTLPVGDDWPGFYGAPWIARINGDLIVLLDVYAPRDLDQPVPAPRFQIYPDLQHRPAWNIQAPARFYRGSKAVLYRVFLTGPARCLDLVVQNGENNGTGHLYSQKYHHYYQTDAIFEIQQ
jgi:hypothetical protein